MKTFVRKIVEAKQCKINAVNRKYKRFLDHFLTGVVFFIKQTKQNYSKVISILTRDASPLRQVLPITLINHHGQPYRNRRVYKPQVNSKASSGDCPFLELEAALQLKPSSVIPCDTVPL